MPAITLTPGSSTPSIISLTYNAGALTGSVNYSAGTGEYSFDDPYSYIIQTAGGTYYWATSGGVSEVIEALNPSGYPVTSAEKNTVVYGVRGLVSPDFVQAGYNYLFDDGYGNYTWCNSIGTQEETPVSANPINTEFVTAYRYGELWNYVGIIGGGGGTGTGTGTGEV